MSDVIIIGHTGKSSVFPALNIEYHLLSVISVPVKEQRSRFQENIMILMRKLDANDVPILEKSVPKHDVRASSVKNEMRLRSFKSSVAKSTPSHPQRARRLPRNKK